tara:strand:+ start:188 stop:409 length:222 start_codon:yes stop_codon:yes gene_type:complete
MTNAERVAAAMTPEQMLEEDDFKRVLHLAKHMRLLVQAFEQEGFTRMEAIYYAAVYSGNVRPASSDDDPPMSE